VPDPSWYLTLIRLLRMPQSAHRDMLAGSRISGCCRLAMQTAELPRDSPRGAPLASAALDPDPARMVSTEPRRGVGSP